MTLTSQLPRHGFQSELVAGSVGEREGTMPGAASHVNYWIPALRRELNPIRDLRAGLALTLIAHRRRPTIMHTHQAKAGTLGRVAASRARVPILIHTYHGHVLEGYFSSPLNMAFLEVERRLAEQTDVLIAVSSLIRDELLALGVGEPGQWRVVPVGLDLANLMTNGIDKVSARAALELPLERPLVGIVGRLAPIKDLETYLAACVEMAKADAKVNFVVAGDGPMRLHLEREAKRLLGDRIRFLGWCENLPALYSALDVVVLTSRNEGTPVALIEASASGLPVVGTRVGGVPDVIRYEQTGFLVEARDSSGIAERVVSLLEDPDYAARLGSAGRQHVKDRYSAQRLVDDVAALYTELLSR